MSCEGSDRILAAAHRLREQRGPGFALSLLARPAGMSRATLYRRLATDRKLAAELRHIREDGATSPREELIRAATALLAETGIAGLQMDAVARRAGYSTATLYRHFQHREALIRQVLRSSLPAQSLQQILTQPGPPEEVLAQFVDSQLATLREHPHLLRILLGTDADHVRAMSRLRRDEERVSVALIAYFERARAQVGWADVSPERLAAALFGQVLAAVIAERLHERMGSPDAREIVALFLGGALKRTSERNAT